MGWREVLRREFLEADREFTGEVLPLGGVDHSAFGLLAEAVPYVLVEERGEVHIQPDTAALSEVLRSLARGGRSLARKDAEQALQRFAALWEGKARARGTWEKAVRVARESGELRAVPPRKRRFLFWRG